MNNHQMDRDGNERGGMGQFCEIQSTANSSSGCITAQGRTREEETTGFAFVGGSITGTGDNLLGRAYGSYSRVVFIAMYMEGIVNPVGWSDWPASQVGNTTERYGRPGRLPVRISLSSPSGFSRNLCTYF